jgi:hypothetical protein
MLRSPQNCVVKLQLLDTRRWRHTCIVCTWTFARENTQVAPAITHPRSSPHFEASSPTPCTGLLCGHKLWHARSTMLPCPRGLVRTSLIQCHDSQSAEKYTDLESRCTIKARCSWAFFTDHPTSSTFRDIMLYSLLVAALLKASSCAAVPTASPFTFYEMPTALSGPCDMCEGHDGYVYI